MANCRHCGYPLSENDRTCFMCGTEVQAAPAPQPAPAAPVQPGSGSMDLCPSCGCPLDANDTVCSLCGTEIPGRKPAPAPVQTAPAQPASGGVDLCPSCGCPLDANDTVCSLCGTEIPGRKPAPAPAQAARTAQTAPVQPVSGGVELCPQCGCPLDADDTVCSLCGAKIPARAAAPQAHAAPQQTYQPVQQSYQAAPVQGKRPAAWLGFLFGYLIPYIAVFVWLFGKNSSDWVSEDVKQGLIWFGICFALIAVTGGALTILYPIGAVVGAWRAGK